MSKFNSYAKQVDDIIREHRTEYRTALAKLIDAEEQYKKAQAQQGLDSEHRYKAELANAELQKAKDGFQNVRKTLASMSDSVADIRKELISAINSEYASKPSDVDMQTMELLKSGILTDRDYLDMLNNAQSRTMKRLIADSFGKWIDANKSIETSKAYNLKQVIASANRDDSKQYIDAFDYLADVVNRTARNNAMFDRWEDITASIIENF